LHLHIDTSGTISNSPVLLVEGGLPQFNQNAELPTNCHEVWSAELNQELMQSTKIADTASTIYFKLLSPFAEVLCFFAAARRIISE
jgi:hypothetical protein